MRWLGEVQVISRPRVEPLFHLWMRVRSVVIQHNVNFQIGGHCAVDPSQESKKLLAAMTRQAFGDDVSIDQVGRSKQGRSAVRLVLVGFALRNTRTQGP